MEHRLVVVWRVGAVWSAWNNSAANMEVLNMECECWIVLECRAELNELPWVCNKWRSVEQGEEKLIEVAACTHEICRRRNVSHTGEARTVGDTPWLCTWRAACKV